MSRSVRLACLLCVLGLAAMTPVLAHHTESQHVNRASEGWPVADFTLLDQQGNAFTQDRLQGRWTFVLFGDTRCADPCVAALSAMAGLYRRIAGTEALKTTALLFISLDPKRDTPARLQQYLVRFDQRFIGVTGSGQTLQRLADDLGFTEPVQPGLINVSNHDYGGSLFLIGPDGAVRGEFLPPFDVLLLTAEYLKTRLRH